MVSYICNELETVETNSCFAAKYSTGFSYQPGKSMRFAGLLRARAPPLFAGSYDRNGHLNAAFREVRVWRPFCVSNAPVGGFLSNLWSESPPLPRSAETLDISFAPPRFHCTEARNGTRFLPKRVVMQGHCP